ncbi:TPA: cysteine--tRNA ligase [Candidatus Woesearchaeota archaeon]|nr:cysteine--tRNA ligase [Candidatus Woesearchaeota archaeon]
MAFNLHNTLTRKKEEFVPLDDGKVRMYSCGPTVWDYAHVGNFRAYICVDVLKRYMLYKGSDVIHIMNITDVDDKIIKRSVQEKKPFRKITEFYTREFFHDSEQLRIKKADLYPKATEHISHMVRIIQQLMKNGHAYRSEDGSVYYNIASFKDYGKLSHSKISSLKAGARVKQDSYDKENAQDFALWKAWDREDGNVFWETELGKGRPGWHIECSAMSMQHLGESFDIHAGGVDLIFPHHENEIAQSEGATGKPFAAHWFHNEHLLVDGKKMSKSLGNFYTLRDLMKEGHKPVAIRYFLLSTHYRVQLNLTEEALRGAQQAVDRINDFVLRLVSLKHEGKGKKPSKEIASLAKKAEKDFAAALDDDLNISASLAHLFDFIRDVNGMIDRGKFTKSDARHVLDAMRKFDTVLDVLEKQEELDDGIKKLVLEREAARKNRDFKTADGIRDELAKKGITLQDTKDGVVWKRT